MMATTAGSGGSPAPPNIKELAKMAQLAVSDAEVRFALFHARRAHCSDPPSAVGAAASASDAACLMNGTIIGDAWQMQVADWEPKINSIVDW